MDSLLCQTLPATGADRIYTGSVGRLLLIGEASDRRDAYWPDYAAEFGITHADEPALIDMACDESLHQAGRDTEAVWAPVHAWRALGQMRSAAAVEPLLRWVAANGNDDTAMEQLPIVLALIGKPALPHLRAFLVTDTHPVWSTVLVQEAATELGQRHPDCREDCIEALLLAFDSHARFSRYRIGFALADLIDLNAVEQIDAIRDAFARGVVDISIAGDLEDVEIELGLRAHRQTPKPTYRFAPSPDLSDPIGLYTQPAAHRPKIGRNDSCPCGSGKKYKKCCLHAA